MTDHRFFVGQQVRLERYERTKAAEVVEVLRQMPSDMDGEPQYRVKASHESFERTAKEHQLSAVIPPSAQHPPPLQVATPPADDLLVVEVPPLPPPLVDLPPKASPQIPSPATLIAAPAAEAPTIVSSPPVAAAITAPSAIRPLSSG